MSSNLNEQQNAIVGMSVGVFEVNELFVCVYVLYVYENTNSVYTVCAFARLQ
jgi:hypothetical protein